MTARVLFIGLDATDATLLERWAEQGYCPNIKAARERGATIDMASSLETLPGAIWPEIVTSMGCGRQAHFYHGQQLHTGEDTKRPIAADEVDGELYYWVRASRAGLRVFSADIPQTVPVAGVNGLQLFEYGCHDRNFAVTSEPPSLLEDIRAKWGDHPVDSCDWHGATEDGYRSLLERLKRGTQLKTEIFRHYLQSESWDLFNVCLTEAHCGGHQFWHFLDPTHPRHDPNAPEDFKNAVRDIYAGLDASIGALVEAAGPEAKVVILASHGMTLYTGGPNLLNEVLARMGLNSNARSEDNNSSLFARLMRTLQFSSHPVLWRLREAVKPLIGKKVIQSIQAGAGSLHEPFSRKETRAAELRNNRCGAIRLNLKGREPHGDVAPGNEAIALLETIREALLELRHPVSKEPIVALVRTAKEAFGPDHHPDVPDLMVVFRDDLGVLDAAWSERLGLIKRSVFQHWLPRSGDHTPHSRLWVMGGPFSAGAYYAGADVLDVGPTLLALLGAPAPTNTDGRNLTALIAGEELSARDPRVGPRVRSDAPSLTAPVA
jgi:predicted AlkP superfamily phosphohydrolase/phosphomutase